MASAQSASFAAVPGYVPRPSSTSTFGSSYPTIPTLPTLPTLTGDASAPGYAGRQVIAGQIGALPGQQNAAFTGVNANARQALAGYGGYTWGVDDPNTPQREDLLLSYDASKAMGQREKQASAGARNSANAANMLSSSFANQNIASAVQRVSLEGQQIAAQYGVAINQIATNFVNQGNSLVGDYAGLFGSDSAWLIDHPPTPPTVPANSNPYNASPYPASVIEAAAAPYLAGPYGPAATGPNPLKGVNGAWGTTYKPPKKKGK